MAWGNFKALTAANPLNTTLPQTVVHDQDSLDAVLNDPRFAGAFGTGGSYSGGAEGYKTRRANNISIQGSGHVQDGKWVGHDPYLLKKGLPILGGIVTAGLAGPAIYGALQGGSAAAGAGAAATAAPATAGAATAGGGFLGSVGGIKGILSGVGPIAGAMAGARGAGRLAEGEYDLQRGRAESERSLANAALDDRRFQQALRLALLGGIEDTQITPPAHIAARMPQMTGGLKPSALKGREDIIAAMQPRILELLMSGNHVPELPDAPDSNFLDKLLEGTSYGSALLGSLPKRTPAPTSGVNIGAKAPNLVSNSGATFGWRR